MMSVGSDVNLGPGDVVLDRVAAPPPKRGTAPSQFSVYVYCGHGQTAGWIKTPRGTEVDLSLGHIVLDGSQPPPPQKGHSSPSFRPMSIVAKVAHLSYC